MYSWWWHAFWCVWWYVFEIFQDSFVRLIFIVVICFFLQFVVVVGVCSVVIRVEVCVVVCILIWFFRFVYMDYIHECACVWWKYYIHVWIQADGMCYGVASVSRIDKITGLFCRISSVLWGSFAKGTHNFIDPTKQSQPIHRTPSVNEIQQCHSNRSLQSQSNGSLFNGTWQKRRRALVCATKYTIRGRDSTVSFKLHSPISI